MEESKTNTGSVHIMTGSVLDRMSMADYKSTFLD